MNDYNRRWRQSHPDTARAKYKRKFDRTYFGGRRSQIIERAGYRCEMCGCDLKRLKPRQIHVHHRDGSGSNGAPRNNAPANLMALCAGCHNKAHRNRHRARKEVAHATA